MEFRYLTTYRKDYKPKKISYVKKTWTEQEYKNPLNESYRDYLKLRVGKHDLQPKEEYADDYLEKFKKIYPKLGEIYFQTPLNVPVIERDSIMDGQTVYQVDYCDSEKDRAYLEELRRRQTFVLPSDWFIPQTTSMVAYRDPRLLEKNALKVVKPMKPPPEEWGTSSKVADILQLTTGTSEYQGGIGQLGELIVTEQIHGKIVHPKCTCLKHNPPKEL